MVIQECEAPAVFASTFRPDSWLVMRIATNLGWSKSALYRSSEAWISLFFRFITR